MEIVITNYLFYYLFIFLIVPLLLLKGSKLYGKEFNEDGLNKHNTNALKGLSVLMVVFCHIGMFAEDKNIVNVVFANLGGLAVAIFLFVSGYGLATQFYKRNNYLKGFIIGKVVKLYFVFLVSNIVVTVINNIFLETNYNVMDIIKSSLIMNFSDGRELWFVAIILFFYVAFYFSFKFLKDKKAVIAICIAPILYIVLCQVLGRGLWWYNTAFCFPIGILTAYYKSGIVHFLKMKFNYLLPLSLIGTVGSLYLSLKVSNLLQFATPLIFILVVLLILMKVDLNSKVMNFINNISFEIYLLHLVILKVIFDNGVARDSIYLVISLPIIVLVSFMVHWVVEKIYGFRIKMNAEKKTINS